MSIGVGYGGGVAVVGGARLGSGGVASQHIEMVDLGNGFGGERLV